MGAPKLSDEILGHDTAKDCKEPMGWTSENVANDFTVTREEMDDWAATSAAFFTRLIPSDVCLRSFQRASRAQRSGYFRHEIVPVEAFSAPAGSISRRRFIVTEDDGIRHGTTSEALSNIRPAFPDWGGKTTGGNASQITDGAAAALMMKRSTAESLGFKVIGKYVQTAVVGRSFMNRNEDTILKKHRMQDCLLGLWELDHRLPYPEFWK